MTRDSEMPPLPAGRGVSVVIVKQVGGAAPGGRAIAREPAAAHPTDTHANRTVLAIDDSPVHLKIMTRYVEQALGCRVVPADGVEAAVVALLREVPDLVIADLMMPNLDGLDLVQIISVREAWRRIPIVIHSAANHLSGIRSLSEFGVRDYILKPFDPAIALPRLRRVLAAHGSPGKLGTSPSEPSSRTRVPILIVTRRPEIAALIQGMVGPLYEIVVAPSGPAAVVRAMEIIPWLVFVYPDLTLWDVAKTRRSLLSLNAVPRLRVVEQVCSPDDDTAVLSTVANEIGDGPFSAEGEPTLMVRLRETFTTGCLPALATLLADRVRHGVEKIVFEIPTASIEPHALAGVTELARRFRR